MLVDIARFIARWPASVIHKPNAEPWHITTSAMALLTDAIATLGPDYAVSDGIAVHHTAAIEPGAILKSPVIIGPRSFVAASAYLRGGVFLDEDCIVGPSCELKTTFLFAGAKVAHLSFVGDSLLGAGVNIEAGAIIANYRNEMDDRAIRIARHGSVIETGVDKFGALIGDAAKIGANSVVAPGALIEPGARIARLTRIDQHPEALP